jgi:xanthine dehydrogenase accessory factor
VERAAAPPIVNVAPAEVLAVPGGRERSATGRWLRPLLCNWPVALCRLLEANDRPVVRILVAEIRGSTPREPGACMLVSGDAAEGTIGGGSLEWRAIRAARTLLLAGPSAPPVQIRRLVLGRELGQCCGGVVQLWLERFTRADLPLLQDAGRSVSGNVPAFMATEYDEPHVTRRLVSGGPVRIHFKASSEHQGSLLERLDTATPKLWLYGAGHVGQALIRMLGELPFDVTWVDSRAGLLPESLPDNVHALNASNPVDTIAGAPPGARYLVLTHDHALDYELCLAILRRGEFAWLGLIGSKSKAARFRSRLARDGITRETIARLVCPIGIEGIKSKWPAAIAVAVAAQLLQSLSTVADAPQAAVPSPSAAETPAAVDAPFGAEPSAAVDGSSHKALPADGSSGDASCASRDCATCQSSRSSSS